MLGRLRSQKGTQLVEMAVVCPFLVLVALGATDFARVSYTTITLSNAARTGAQWAIQSAAHAANTTGIASAAQNEANDLGGSISVTSSRFCRCVGTTAVVSCTTGACAGGVGKEMFVTVNCARTFTTMVPYPGIPASIAMTRSATLRVQ